MRDFSYQLYSSRAFPPMDGTLRMLADLGYSQVEGFGGLYPDLDAARALRDLLDEAGLAMPTAHVGLSAIEADPAGVVDIARALGIKAIFAPHIGPDERPRDAAGWAAFGCRVAEAGKPLQDAGLIYGWHNHDFEFLDLGGTDLPLDLILAGSDDLRLELDAAWVARGGHDPVAWLRKYGDRIVAIHVKDIAPNGENETEDGWADVGHGIMDWHGIMAAARDTGARWFVMEHDNPADHHRFAERSIAAARTF